MNVNEITPAQKIALMVQMSGAHKDNAELAEPGTPGHEKPWEPWSAPVMLLAGWGPSISGSVPWLYLACTCGWWLGFSSQYDPANLARTAAAHSTGCTLHPATPETAGDSKPDGLRM